MDAITKQYWVLLASVLSRDNISRYFYGVLHESNYREVYAADLKRESSMVCVREGFLLYEGDKPLSVMHCKSPRQPILI